MAVAGPKAAARPWPRCGAEHGPGAVLSTAPVPLPRSLAERSTCSASCALTRCVSVTAARIHLPLGGKPWVAVSFFFFLVIKSTEFPWSSGYCLWHVSSTRADF